jgi:hypothetical protein
MGIKGYFMLKFMLGALALIGLCGCEEAPQEPTPSPKAPAAGQAPRAEIRAAPVPLDICSFNIQFLGNSRSRDDAALAYVLKDCEVAVVQELVAPPSPGVFPDGKVRKADAEAKEFFDAMEALGFSYLLSEEDTGSGAKIHLNSSATEWWVAFYKKDAVEPAVDLPSGFLAADRSDHPDYERVPYAFAFRSRGGADFVLVSVHLKPGSGKKARARRQHELDAIGRWIGEHDAVERDFIVLGDMNIENAKELAAATPVGFVSLNDECRPTNTNVNKPKPYDHVMLRMADTREVDVAFDLQVVDLVEAMQPFWKGDGPYPGKPYDHNGFRKYYSDHHPVVFRLKGQGDDD